LRSDKTLQQVLLDSFLLRGYRKTSARFGVLGAMV
jgi:hypothetical protein